MATGEGQASRLLEDVERYAALSAALSVAAERYAQVLAAHGLDDEAWEAIDERWQARFSAALELATEGPPELMDRFSEAFSRALAGHAGGGAAGRALRRHRGRGSTRRFARSTAVARRRGDRGVLGGGGAPRT